VDLACLGVDEEDAVDVVIRDAIFEQLPARGSRFDARCRPSRLDLGDEAPFSPRHEQVSAELHLVGTAVDDETEGPPRLTLEHVVAELVEERLGFVLSSPGSSGSASTDEAPPPAAEPRASGLEGDDRGHDDHEPLRRCPARHLLT